MKIEAHLVELENPFIPAQRAFEELVEELSGGETQKKTHSELENLINVRGIEVMGLLLEGHLAFKGRYFRFKRRRMKKNQSREKSKNDREVKFDPIAK